MQVLKRSQVTEVTTKRQVIHYLLFEGIKYSRVETINVYQSYMDCTEPISRSKVKWSKYIGERVVEYLSAKEVKVLGLNDLFNLIDINSRNGN